MRGLANRKGRKGRAICLSLFHSSRGIFQSQHKRSPLSCVISTTMQHCNNTFFLAAVVADWSC
jgi:hypothetical protein